MPKAQLVELSAQSLGVIEQASLEFADGFCVLTGETGAGKTLLLGALELCLGGDGAQSRHGISADTKASVVFAQGDQEVVLSREASATGRLRATVNGLASNAESLRNAAEPLIVIHGQHDSLSLKSRAEILKLIDNFGQIDTASFDSLNKEVGELRRLRESVGGDETGRERELDFLKFQAKEIEDAKVSDANELSETLQRLQSLTEVSEGQAAVVEVVAMLDEMDTSILDQFAVAINRIPQGEAYAAITSSLRQSLEIAREATRELVSLADPDAVDADALRAMEDRVATLQALIRKHGSDLAAVIAKGQELARAIAERETALEKLATVDVDLERLDAQLKLESDRLLASREHAAAQLSQSIAGQLERVALPNASLRFVVSGTAGSQAEILFTPNPGQPEGPLQSLASGGELSRVLLAISLETSNDDQVAVFDEVDAGIGGQVAQQIGECLQEVGAKQQVLAVTHLASVAAKANQHFVIEKLVVDAKTVTTVREVTGAERVREIARMLAGEVNEASIGLAEHMLQPK